MSQAAGFDPNCTKCPRLTKYLRGIRKDYPDYHARPVAPFGDRAGRLLVVGLAPGLHGANATGRPFTGDYAGILLYQTLHEFGFSNRPVSKSPGDGLKLSNCRITNAVKCVPPGNKPVGGEVNACNGFLAAELGRLPEGAVVLALGAVAHQAVLKAFARKQSEYRFRHGAVHRLPGDYVLVDSYHCSRYNTQTKRLTPQMFRAVFRKIGGLLE